MANIPIRPPGSFYGLFYGPDTAPNTQDWASYPHRHGTYASTLINQTDLVKSIGGNCIAFFITSFEYVTDGTGYSRETVLSELKRVLDHTLLQRVFVIIYLTTTYSQFGSTDNTQATAEMVAYATLIGKYAHVLAIATVDEPLQSADITTCVANASVQYPALKAVLPSNLPVCAGVCANFVGSGGGSPANPFDIAGTYGSNMAALAAYCDVFIFHPFVTVSLSDSINVRAAYAGKDIIMPSAVLSENGDGDIASKANSIFSLVGANSFRGACWFLAKDFPRQSTSDTFGVFNEDGTERTTKTNAFRANLPVHVAPDRPVRFRVGNPRLNEFAMMGYS